MNQRPNPTAVSGTADAKDVTRGTLPHAPPRKLRFTFIDEFRGLVGVMMALGHANYYLNSAWLSLDPVDPFFDNTGQFLLRYMGYLCAPGFLMMNGAMVYYAYWRRRRNGESDWQARWDYIQRGLFLIAVQLVWVNASWSGFARLRLDHFGIIATIGSSMLILILMVRWRWWARASVALVVAIAHVFLLRIPYDLESWTHYPMQLFVTSGHFNKYPIFPWFVLACVGSVMAHFWFEVWRDPDRRAAHSLLVGGILLAIAWALRMAQGFGNIFPYDTFFSYSFFLVQKYPPSLVHQFWFAGAVIMMVGIFSWIDARWPILRPLAIVGRVPLFYYAVHIPLLAIFTRRFPGLFYREGAVAESLIGWVALLVVMYPLAIAFGRVKRRSRAWIIRMI